MTTQPTAEDSAEEILKIFITSIPDCRPDDVVFMNTIQNYWTTQGLYFEDYEKGKKNAVDNNWVIDVQGARPCLKITVVGYNKARSMETL